MTRLDRDRAEPLYHQLQVLLRGRILSGEWAPGTRIPTEHELCDSYGVSRVTTRQAVRNLVDEGYLVRQAGRGTFVKAPVLTAGERGLGSFSQDMRDLNLAPGSVLLSFEVREAYPAEMERLDLPAGAEVICLNRLRTGDGHPIGLQLTRLPASRFPDLSREDVAKGSLYELLQAEFGVQIREAHETFWATKVTPEDAVLLNVAAGAPAFRVERVAWDQRGPMEFTASVMRGDRYRIKWVLTGPASSRPDRKENN